MKKIVDLIKKYKFIIIAILILLFMVLVDKLNSSNVSTPAGYIKKQVVTSDKPAPSTTQFNVLDIYPKEDLVMTSDSYTFLTFTLDRAVDLSSLNVSVYPEHPIKVNLTPARKLVILPEGKPWKFDTDYTIKINDYTRNIRFEEPETVVGGY